MYVKTFDDFVLTFFCKREVIQEEKKFPVLGEDGKAIKDKDGKEVLEKKLVDKMDKDGNLIYRWTYPTGLAAAALRRWGIPTRHWKEYWEYLLPIAEFIWNCNAIGHLDDVVDSREFDRIEIPDEFKGLVLPKGVYLNPLIQPSKDLLDRPKGVSLAKLEDKYQGYKSACEAWRYKSPQEFQSTGHFTKLSELKTEVAITSIESRLEIGGKVDFNGSEGFIPIPVNKAVGGLYINYKFNDSPKFAIQEYINNFKF